VQFRPKEAVRLIAVIVLPGSRKPAVRGTAIRDAVMDNDGPALDVLHVLLPSMPLQGLPHALNVHPIQWRQPEALQYNSVVA